MQISTIQKRLADLPNTFKAGGSAYAQLQVSLALGLSRYALNEERLSDTVSSIQNASGPWLDLWLRIFGYPRFTGELDNAYRTRVLAVLQISGGSAVSIANYIQESFGLAALVTQTTDVVKGTGSWSLSLPGAATATTTAAILSSLNRVRPAGVPFTLGVRAGGLYLTSVNFMRGGRLSGAYVVQPVQAAVAAVSGTTNSLRPLIPTTYLTDPMLNA